MLWGPEETLQFNSYLAFLGECSSASVVERAAEPTRGVLESPDVKQNSRPSLRTLKKGREHSLCLTLFDSIQSRVFGPKSSTFSRNVRGVRAPMKNSLAVRSSITGGSSG